MFLFHQSVLVEEMEITLLVWWEMWNEKRKKEKSLLGMRLCLLFWLPFTEEMNWCIFLLDFYPSGLTGLEPAASALTGRCSDQLNYNPRKKSVQHAYSYNFIQTFSIFILDSNCLVLTGRDETNILIFIWICTLARSTRIISNPFVISKSIENQSFNKSMKIKNKKSPFLFRLYTYRSWYESRPLARSEFVEKIRNKINSGRDVADFYSCVSKLIGHFRRTTNGYIISWWIGKLLGRAGFEPA